KRKKTVYILSSMHSVVQTDNTTKRKPNTVTFTTPQSHRLYQFYETPMNWRDAHAFCKVHEFDLATIDSMEDHRRLLESTGHPDTGIIWIGLVKSDTEQWVWSEGIGAVTVFNFSANKGAGDCVWMGTNGYWNADTCSNKRPFMCFECNSQVKLQVII
uniref:C-type lectin domain-containing protein n=1 Tax=Oreochromis aureus TaxID=47969 RepID=A0AAZ1X2I6_OREAU